MPAFPRAQVCFNGAMPPRRRFRLRLPSRTLVLGERTLVMGVINVTPDSFSDGGRYFDADSATDRALAMEREGADLIDIGGESTRPGSQGVSMQEEIRRVLSVIVRLRRKLKIPISIDTQKSAVAEAAVGAGAEIINDVSALRTDPELASVARRHDLPLVLMHMRGRPRTMQKLPFARNVLADVTRGLRDALSRARNAGLPKSRLILDPGIGFGKSYQQNCELLARLRELAQLGCPLLVGASRKSFIGKLLGDAPADRRMWGTAAAVTASILGGAHIVRVHDVAEMVQVALIADRILQEM